MRPIAWRWGLSAVIRGSVQITDVLRTEPVERIVWRGGPVPLAWVALLATGSVGCVVL